ncbi:MAG: hypothetical protein C0594_00610 [Marinilabiliales bacterium]|nr:MAG: hypothetical protein C0594_00610 [Marinilabiliales bacterium]
MQRFLIVVAVLFLLALSFSCRKVVPSDKARLAGLWKRITKFEVQNGFGDTDTVIIEEYNNSYLLIGENAFYIDFKSNNDTLKASYLQGEYSTSESIIHLNTGNDTLNFPYTLTKSTLTLLIQEKSNSDIYYKFRREID